MHYFQGSREYTCMSCVFVDDGLDELSWSVKYDIS